MRLWRDSILLLLPWILLAVQGRGVLALLGFERGADAAMSAWLALLAPVGLALPVVRSKLGSAWASFDDAFARAGALLIVVLLSIALFAPLLATHVPDALGDPVDDR